MSDLVVGVVIIGVLSSLLLVGMLRLSRSLPQRTVNLLAIMLVSMLFANALLIQDSVFLTHLLPVSNLIIVGNPALPLVAALAGLIWYRVPPPMARRGVIIGALVIVALVAIYRPMLSKPPMMGDRWDRGVCLQTSRASCSPAAAATLLNDYNIKANEQEMALLCLTTDKGTSVDGLWRGLKLKTAGRGFDVYMFNHGTIDDLRNMGPVLLTVELMPDAKVNSQFQASGWLPGVPHTVVLEKFMQSRFVQIADPATGRDYWSIDDLLVLWHGMGARLIRAKS